ncbi:MAG: helix-turn-helix transcriptional regulator [Candidatus Aminicenantes bacterium]|nr:MAG: helix-turn-helix transcriptional regulator [Candidatus Aminicenantes bacterium]
MNGREGSKKFYHISAVSQMYDIHPQTLRLYEREGLLKPSRSDGNTRLYSEDDLRQLEFILNLTRDLGVNLAGVEVVINMKQRMNQIESEVNKFLEYIKREFVEGQEEEFELKRQSLIRITPGKIVKIERIKKKKDEK